MAGLEYGMTSSENHVKIGLKTDVSIQSFRILSSKNYLHALKLLTYILLEVFFSFFKHMYVDDCYFVFTTQPQFVSNSEFLIEAQFVAQNVGFKRKKSSDK